MAKRIKQTRNEQKTLGSSLREMYYSVPDNIRYIVLWLVSLIILFLVLSYLFPIIFKALGVGTVSYGGLTFTKEVLGQNKNQINIYHYYYLYRDASGQLVQNNIYLRNNPAEINIPVRGDIAFFANTSVIIALDTDNLLKCNQSSIAIGELSSFIRNAGHNVSAGILNKTEAQDQNISYADCGTTRDSMTIRVIIGNESSITSNANYGCYQISAGSCNDLLPASEKFIVQALVDAKNRTNSTSSSG